MMVAFSNPVTGEIYDVPDDQFRVELDKLESWLADRRREMRPVYQACDRLREYLAETTGYEVPPRRNQTETQQKLLRCPRCRKVIREA